MHDRVIIRLKEIALKVAENEVALVARLSSEIDEQETRLAELKAAREPARTAAMRGDNFAPEIEGYITYQCPICWVSQNKQADLRPVPSDNSNDLCRCESCNREIEI
jgi:hypothetical protein